MDNYLTLDFLSTMAGMVFTVTLLTQFFKKLIDKVTHIPTEYVVYCISIVMMVLVHWARGTLSYQNVLMLLINAVLVAMSSMKSYEKLAQSAIDRQNKQLQSEIDKNVNSD